MISEDRVEKALRYLVEDVDASAKAKADLVALEEGRKSLKAQLMKESDGKAVADRENDAYDSKEYRLHTQAMAEATRIAERHRLKREIEYAIIEIWRTEQANNRAADKVR